MLLLSNSHTPMEASEQLRVMILPQDNIRPVDWNKQGSGDRLYLSYSQVYTKVMIYRNKPPAEPNLFLFFSEKHSITHIFLAGDQKIEIRIKLQKCTSRNSDRPGTIRISH